MIDLTSTGRTELLTIIARLERDNALANRNLTAVQERCTELLLENRAMKREPPAETTLAAILTLQPGEDITAAAIRVVNERNEAGTRRNAAFGEVNRVRGERDECADEREAARTVVRRMRDVLGASENEGGVEAAERVMAAWADDLRVRNNAGADLIEIGYLADIQYGEGYVAAVARVVNGAQVVHRNLNSAEEAIGRARAILGAEDDESLYGAATRAIDERNAARDGLPLVEIAQVLEATGIETAMDAARRVVAERDAEMSKRGALLEVLLPHMTDGSSTVTLLRLVRERNDAVAGLAAAVADTSRLTREWDALRTDRDAYKACVESLEKSLDAARGHLGATFVEGIEDVAKRVAREWRESTMALAALRDRHDATARRDADTRDEAATYRAQVEDRDATIRRLEVELGYARRIAGMRGRTEHHDELEPARGGAAGGGA